MRRIRYFVIIFISIMAVLSCIAFASLNSAGTYAGAAVKNARDNSDETRILVTVNGTPISEEQFEVYKTTINFGENSYSDDDLLNKLIEQQLLFDEAKRRGLTASEDEVNEAISLVREMLEDDSQKEAYRFITDYIAELGLTENEYYKSIRPAYEKSLSITNLRNKLLDEMAYELGTDKISQDDFNTYFSNFVSELVESADIKYNTK